MKTTTDRIFFVFLSIMFGFTFYDVIFNDIQPTNMTVLSLIIGYIYLTKTEETQQ